jgi:hypothetical protein
VSRVKDRTQLHTVKKIENGAPFIGSESHSHLSYRHSDEQDEKWCKDEITHYIYTYYDMGKPTMVIKILVFGDGEELFMWWLRLFTRLTPSASSALSLPSNSKLCILCITIRSVSAVGPVRYMRCISKKNKAELLAVGSLIQP